MDKSGKIETEPHMERSLIKLNCWEFKKCGREGDADDVFQDEETCPASIAEYTDGVNDGMNGGRACWAIAGTFCRGEIQGVHAKEINNCFNCDFYLLVKRDEGKKLETGSELALRILESE